MKRLLAQRDLEAMMTSLSPLLPLVSRKSCEAGTNVLAFWVRRFRRKKLLPSAPRTSSRCSPRA